MTMGDDVTLTNIYIYDGKEYVEIGKVKKDTVTLSRGLWEPIDPPKVVLRAIFQNYLKYHGSERRQAIRILQQYGLLKKPKTTYRTNNEYFKKRRK